MLKSIAAAGVALLGLAGHAWAQAWPQKPVTFIVSAAAGASPDVMARLLADGVSRTLGQPVGGDGVIMPAVAGAGCPAASLQAAPARRPQQAGDAHLVREHGDPFPVGQIDGPQSFDDHESRRRLQRSR